jgi:translocation and assembly module TamB
MKKTIGVGFKLTGVTVLVLGAVMAAGILWYLRTDRFQESARLRLEAGLGSATGLVCKIGRLHLDLIRGGFVLDNVSLLPHFESPEFLSVTVESVSGSFGLRSPWRMRLQLSDVEIVRPRVTVHRGQPQLASHGDEIWAGLRRSFEFTVSHVAIKEGALIWTDQAVPFEVRLTGLVSEIRYRDDPARYDVHVAYDDGRMVGGGREISHGLDARFVFANAGLELESVAVRRGHSLLECKGRLLDWNRPVLTLHTTGTVASQDLAAFVPLLSDVQAEGGISADFRWDGVTANSGGHFNAVSVAYRGIGARQIQGAFAQRNAAVTFRDVRGTLKDGGSFRGGCELQLTGQSNASSTMEFTAEGVPLATAALVLRTPGLGFSGTADAHMKATWKAGLSDLDLSATVDLKAARNGAGDRPLAPEGQLEFALERGQWIVRRADLRSRDTMLQLTGISGDALHVRAYTDSATEPLTLVSGVSTDAAEFLGRFPDLKTISGRYELEGELELRSLVPRAFHGRLQTWNARYRGFAFDTVTANADWAGGGLSLRSVVARKGAEYIQGDMTCRLPSTTTQPPLLSFQGAVQNVSLSSLNEIGFGPGFEMSGTLTGNGSIAGAQGSWRGEGEFAVRNGSFRGEEFDLAQGTVEAAGRLLRITRGTVRRGLTQVELRGEVELEGDRGVRLTAQLASLPLGELPVIRERKIDLEGRLTGSGRISGTFERPVFEGTFSVDGLRYGAWVLGQGKGALAIENKILRANFNLVSSLGNFETQATISGEPGYPGKAALNFRNWNVRSLLPAQIPPFLSDLSTILQGTILVEGRFAEPRTLQAHGQVEGGRFKVRGYDLRNAGAIQFAVAERKLRVAKVTLLGDGTTLDLNGTIPLDANPTLDLALNGSVNLSILETVERRLRSSGSARLNVRVSGPLRNPQIVGQASLEKTMLAHRDFPFPIASLQGDVFFSRDLIRLEKLHGNFALGTVEVSGVVEPYEGQFRNANLHISVRKARLPYPVDFRSVFDADLLLRGGPDSQLLSGEVNVIRTEYLRDLNLFELLASRSSIPLGPLVTDPLVSGLRLDVSIRSDNGLLIENALTNVRGGMRLSLTGSPAYPSLTGRVDATEGIIFFRGNRFEIMRASADLIDRDRINPVVEVRAEADVRAYRLVLNVSGDLDHLNVNLTSDPPLSTTDVVSLLATGKAAGANSLSTGESSRRESQLTGVTAASLLSEGLTGAIGKRVERIFGFQSFRVDPFLAGAENDPTARVTISERISKDLSVTFSRNLSTNEEQIVMVEYDVSRDLSIVATRDEKGQFGLDFRFRRRYR